MVKIQRVTSPQEFERAFAVRRTVFIEEQGVPETLERDEYDRDALHLMALERDQVIGTVRLAMIHGVPRLGRMAVLKAHRGTGVGKALLEAMMAEAARQGVADLHLAAQLTVEGFYANAGFTPYGEVFEEAGILHRMMKKALPDQKGSTEA